MPALSTNRLRPSMEEPLLHAGPLRPAALVIDDSPVECMLATAVLQKLGFSVTCAASAEQALAHLAGNRFDLAICDISLPEMDGLTLVAAMRAESQPPHCIVLSAHDDRLHEQKARQAGACAYLVKPLRLETMRTALDALFQERRVQ
jgi:CheY-like chemotaxis protein